MADKIVKIYGDARFLPRHDTLENWQRKNPILLEAEPSYVIDGEDGKKIKFGDGVTPWNDLPYLSSNINNGGDITVDQSYNPESENAQSGKAVAEALQGANSQWKKLADVTITEEVNTITCTHEDMPQCKEFILRAIFPASTTGETVSLGATHCYLNNNIIGFRFPATNINKSVITEQRCHILIADDLIYSIGTEGAYGQAAIVANVNTIVGNRVITDNVTQIIYKLNDSTKSYQIGTQFQVYGKVEK